MNASKEAHFNFLQALEHRYEDGGTPSSEEKHRLQSLLDVHNSRVKAFRVATKTLQKADLVAYEAFLLHLTSTNQ